MQGVRFLFPPVPVPVYCSSFIVGKFDGGERSISSEDLSTLSAYSFIGDHAARLNQISHWLPLHTYPESQLEIQQAPNAIAVVAMACHVLGEQAPEDVWRKRVPRSSVRGSISRRSATNRLRLPSE